METPQLAHLMGAYFHQDYDVYDGTIWGPLTEYVSDTTPHERRALLDEIAAVMQNFTTEETLDQFLDSLDSSLYMADAPGGYRGWLEKIARRIEASLPT